jgi:hypothetical protein
MADGKFLFETKLLEATIDKKKREIAGILLTAGKSQRKNFYSPEVVETATPMFEGVKMYIDHPNEEDVGKTRSIRDWGATILETAFDASKKGTVARIGVRSPWLWENVIVPAHDGGYLDEVGISINAVGPTRLGEIDGETVRIVESIRKVFSADFVSEASAGGKVTQMLESAQQELEEDLEMLDKLTLEELVELRPDLVEAIMQEAASDEEEYDDDEVAEGLLECMQMIAEDVDELREDVSLVIDEFAEGLEMMGDDVESLMEGNDDEEEYDDEDYLNESVDYGRNTTPIAYYGNNPEVYDELAILRENQQVLIESNERLREDMILQTSYSLAVQKLVESNLPEATQERLLPAMINCTSDQMDALIESEYEHLQALEEELGGVIVSGAGSWSEEELLQESYDMAQDRLDTLLEVAEDYR